MTAALTSVIVPTFQHAATLREAVDSALAQTAPTEVIVVDDGSTDGTARVLDGYRANPHVRTIVLPHGGPSVARNAGLDAARGEFVMFLDADDIIAPDKVRRQIAEFDDLVDWVICDVRIDDSVRNRVELASERYRYADRQLGGWIRDQLAISNFIPIMSPLIRRAALTPEIRFGDLLPEDWHFWYRLAGHARVRYLPRVLATYRKQRHGRNAGRLGVQHVSPAQAPDGPLLLNLGCGTPGADSWHPQPGCVNLDRSLGWCFEDGLPQYAEGSVDGITVSHALMYVDLEDWPKVFAEFARVLMPNGVIRITEDDTVTLGSQRRGGWKGSEPAVTLTSRDLVAQHLTAVGLTPLPATRDTSHYRTRALCQGQHGDPPDVFFLEGRKDVGEIAIAFSPHADDEALFAAYWIQAHRARVVICFPSVGDYGDTATRLAESRAAMAHLDAGPVDQWNGLELEAKMRELDARWQPAHVAAPDLDASHPDHVAVAAAARAVFGDRVTAYHTYRDGQKVRRGHLVDPPPDQVTRKLRALAEYHSQIAHPRAGAFFREDLLEYVDVPNGEHPPAPMSPQPSPASRQARRRAAREQKGQS